MNGDVDLEFLVKLLRMLESPHDGEVVNAARAACRFIRTAGTSWEDLAIAAAQGDESRRLNAEIAELRRINRALTAEVGRSRMRQPLTEDDAIKFALARRYQLTDWERGFIESIARTSWLSTKQTDRLNRIVAKLQRLETAI